MYLRRTQRQRKDGTRVCYLALAENVWNAQAGRSEVQIVHNLGRADQEGWARLQRLIQSIERVLGKGPFDVVGGDEIPRIEIERSWDLGLVHVAQMFWHELGISAAVQRHLQACGLDQQIEAVLFALLLNRLEECSGGRGAATTLLSERAWLPQTPPISRAQRDEALAVLTEMGGELERTVVENLSARFGLRLDRTFYSTIGGFRDQSPFGAASARPGAADDKVANGRVAGTGVFAMTSAGVPLRSWMVPGERLTATGTREIETVLRDWSAQPCVYVADAPDHFESWLNTLDAYVTSYLAGLPVTVLKAGRHPALAQPGRYRALAAGLRAKQVRLGGTERRRYVVGQERGPARQANGRDWTREAELTSAHGEAGWRCGRVGAEALAPEHGDAETFVCVTNDLDLSIDEIVGAYRCARAIDARLQRRTGVDDAHVASERVQTLKRQTGDLKLSVLALQLQCAAELRAGESWTRLAETLNELKAVQYRTQSSSCVQRTALSDTLAQLLDKLGVPAPAKTLHTDPSDRSL